MRPRNGQRASHFNMKFRARNCSYGSSGVLEHRALMVTEESDVVCWSCPRNSHWFRGVAVGNRESGGFDVDRSACTVYFS